MATQNLPITKVRIDGGTQPRAAISEDTVREYAEAMTDSAVFPPVDVFYDGAEYWLADGFHRYHAAKRLQLLSLPCEVHHGERREAVLFSVGANKSHGLRRTNEDKRKAVVTLIGDEEWSKWSDREIARRCGVSDRFVGQVRSSLRIVRSEDEPASRTYTTKHGTEAQMNVEKIGKSKPTTAAPPAPSMSAAASVAIDGAGHSSLKRFPKKADAEKVTNAVLALQGIADVIRQIDAHELSEHPHAPSWYNAISDVVGVLRSFNRNLSTAKKSEEVA